MQIDDIKVAALATTGFEEVEYTQPRKALEEAGATVHLVSPQSGSIRAWDTDDWGGSHDVDVTLDSADPADYDALLLPGGVLNPDNLRVNEQALTFIKSFFSSNKPVAVICHGGQTLISANLVQGRTMTGFKAVRPDLANAGANVKDEEVVVDGNLISSRNPDDIPAFNKKFIEVLSKSRVSVS